GERTMKKVTNRLAAFLGMMSTASLCGAVDLNRQIEFVIPAQKLDAALMEFSRQAKIQVVASTVNLGDFESAGVSGNLSVGEALRKLLADSGLAIKEIGEETLAIVSRRDESATTTFVPMGAPVRVAETERAREVQDAGTSRSTIALEEVLV